MYSEKTGIDLVTASSTWTSGTGGSFFGGAEQAARKRLSVAVIASVFIGVLTGKNALTS
jgi:hypothetical protein